MAYTQAHIVIIDDDPATLEAICLVLEEEGRYRVTATPHMFEEATALEHLHPDLIIVNVLLPEPSPGWTLLHKLRHYGPTNQIPVIISTTTPPTLFAHQPLLRHNGIAVLYKPFDITDLLHQVAHLLSSSEHHHGCCTDDVRLRTPSV